MLMRAKALALKLFGYEALAFTHAKSSVYFRIKEETKCQM